MEHDCIVGYDPNMEIILISESFIKELSGYIDLIDAPTFTFFHFCPICGRKNDNHIVKIIWEQYEKLC